MVMSIENSEPGVKLVSTMTGAAITAVSAETGILTIAMLKIRVVITHIYHSAFFNP